MHPEIRQEGPGTCPICGMALEPETVSLDEGPDPELVDMSRRFWWSALFTVPLFLYAMSDMVLLDLDRIVDPVRAQWIQLARSEEHTSELQSLMRISYAVFCLKKKKIQH